MICFGVKLRLSVDLEVIHVLILGYILRHCHKQFVEKYN